MAQDSGAQNAPKSDVDIDDLEVEIFILAKNPALLKQTCAFLTRRGWPTEVTGNVTKAIEYIAEKKPDFVLLSFNHTSPALLKLPDLITQTFNLTCIGFLEASDAASSQRLSQISMRNKISNHASGPTIHRMIRRLLGEKFNVAVEGKATTTEENSNAARSESAIPESQTDNGNETYRAAGEKQKSSAGYVVQKGTPGVDSGGNRQAGQGAGDPNSAMQSGGYGQSGSSAQGGSENLSEGSGGTDVVSSGKYTMGKSRRRSLKELTGTKPDATKADLKPFEELNNGSAAAPGAAPILDVVGLLKQSLFGDAIEAAPEATVQDSIEDARLLEPQSVLEKAVSAAFAEICVENLDAPPVLVEKVGQVMVFPIDSPGLPGYLVLALENLPGAAQADFASRSELALKAAFASLGVQGKLEPGFLMSIPKVTFATWADTSGSFHFTVVHEGAELGVVFFHAGKTIPRPQPASKGMVTIGLEHISTNHPVTFKAYLHLEKNEKFFLYLRNGRPLQPEQRDRLTASKVKDFYLKSTDVEKVRLFLASAFLTSSIKKSGIGEDEAA